jgi:hypothetical protein
VMRTSTCGTKAPDESETVPMIVALVSVCAKDPFVREASNTNRIRALKKLTRFI